MKPTNQHPCFAYLRVSSTGQVQGDGFPRQEAAVRKWATANRFRIHTMFREEGVSGTVDHLSRPALSKLFEAVTSYPGTGVTVIVEKADRLARDLVVSELLLRQFRDLGVTVIEAEGGNDLTAGSDNLTSTLIRQILAAVSEFEKSSLVLKLRAARERVKAETGRCGGRWPFGYYPGEKDTLVLMLDASADGDSCRDIADYLNREQIPSRSGKPWSFGAVAKILKANTPQKKKGKK